MILFTNTFYDNLYYKKHYWKSEHIVSSMYGYRLMLDLNGTYGKCCLHLKRAAEKFQSMDID